MSDQKRLRLRLTSPRIELAQTPENTSSKKVFGPNCQCQDPSKKSEGSVRRFRHEFFEHQAFHESNDPAGNKEDP